MGGSAGAPPSHDHLLGTRPGIQYRRWPGEGALEVSISRWQGCKARRCWCGCHHSLQRQRIEHQGAHGSLSATSTHLAGGRDLSRRPPLHPSTAPLDKTPSHGAHARSGSRAVPVRFDGASTSGVLAPPARRRPHWASPTWWRWMHRNFQHPPGSGRSAPSSHQQLVLAPSRQRRALGRALGRALDGDLYSARGCPARRTARVR